MSISFRALTAAIMPILLTLCGKLGAFFLAYAERAGVKIECAYTPNLGSGIVVQGTVPELIRHCGLDENSLAKAAEKLVRGE